MSRNNKTTIPPAPAHAPPAEATGGPLLATGTVDKDGPGDGKSTDPASPDYVTGLNATQDALLTAGAGGSGATGEQPLAPVAAAGSGMAAVGPEPGPDGPSRAQMRKFDQMADHELPPEEQERRGFAWTDRVTSAGRVIEYSTFGAAGTGTTTRAITLPHDKASDADADAARVRLRG